MWLSPEARKYQDLLLMKALELGRIPTFAEVESDDRLPRANDYAPYFGSFSKACDTIRYTIKQKLKEQANSTSDNQ